MNIVEKRSFIFCSLYIFLFGCNSKKEEEYSYYSEGKIKTKIVYKDRSHKEGEFYSYHLNGTLAFQSEMHKGKPSGKSIYYDEKGILRTETFVVDGLRNGFENRYYDDGKLSSKKYFMNGKQEGWGLTFNKDGELTIKGLYRSDTLIYSQHYHKGSFVGGGMLPLVASSSDTINLGGTYELKVKFGFVPQGDVVINSVLIDEENEPVRNLDKFRKVNKNLFLLKILAKQKGDNVINLYVTHKTDKSDTLSADGSLLKHHFFVK
jgi:hypothetical protein